MDPNDGEIVWDRPEDVADAAARPDRRTKRLYAWGDPALPMDEKGRLLTPVTCQGCWADLHGQKIKGKCPECGASVARSARGNRLRFADPAWVETLRSGVSILLLGVLLYVVMLMVVVAVQVGVQGAAVLEQDSGSAKPPTFEQALEQAVGPPELAAVTIVIALIGSVVMMLGVWKLTVPEPGQTKPGDAVAREAFRWGWLTATLLANMGNLLVLTDPTLGAMVSGVSTVFSVVASIAMLLYLRGLAMRIPDEDLAGKTMLLQGLFLLWIAAFFVGMLMVATAVSGAGPSGMSKAQADSFRTGFIVTCSSGVVGVFLAIGWGLLLNAYRKRLAEAYLAAVRTKTVRY